MTQRWQFVHMMRHSLLLRLAPALLLVVAALSLLVSPASAARRAFVVGNASYSHAPALPNPVNDARDLTARLQSLGYTVMLGLDVTRSEFLQQFQAFARALQPNDTALLYFAGHGLQIGGENYLFPVDAVVAREEDARSRLVPLNALLADLSRTTRNRIVILDACRNNPFESQIAGAQATRSANVTRGLARVYAGVGTFVAYSTQPGNVALDGTGRNSPFTGALLRHIAVPRMDVHAVMRRVRGDVQRATNEQQIPWENSSLVDEVAFAPDESAGPSASSGGTAARPVAPPPQPPPTAKAKAYSYVTGLDPKGDNFLALRTSPTAEGVRIATMGPDTLLDVVESRGDWKRVTLPDGTSGWAHGNWIACCRSLPTGRAATPAAAPSPAEAIPAAASASCDELWRRRNAVWHRHGYCFTTDRGKKAFGNAGCSRDQAAARAAMSAADRELVDALLAQERSAGCQ